MKGAVPLSRNIQDNTKAAEARLGRASSSESYAAEAENLEAADAQLVMAAEGITRLRARIATYLPHVRTMADELDD